MLYLITTIILFMIIGIIKLINLKASINQRIIFLNEYQDRFAKYIESLHRKQEAIVEYEWLLTKSSKMQRQLGDSGTLIFYTDGMYQYSNLPVLSLLSEIRSTYQKSMTEIYPIFSLERLNTMISLTVESLVRYRGLLEDREDTLIKQLKNPFSWLIKGVQWIIELPISLLYWTGIIKYSWYSKLTDNIVIKLINLIVVTIGFISAIVTIVTGYTPFFDIVNEWGK